MCTDKGIAIVCIIWKSSLYYRAAAYVPVHIVLSKHDNVIIHIASYVYKRFTQVNLACMVLQLADIHIV